MWSGGIVDWVDEDKAYLSVVFSWDMPIAFQRAAWYKAQGYDVITGGPAVYYDPEYLEDVARVEYSDVAQVHRHNPNATFTSRGCVRECKFCIVPHSEGKLVELDNWAVRPIVCDNNILACSKAHFDNVVDKLKPLSGVDFNQGLDTRLLTKHHANRIAELDISVIRLAWDHSRLENQFMSAFRKLIEAGIKAELTRVYCLIGWNDTPDDALYRLNTIKELGALPNPMRYQPLDSIRRNQYVGDNWTERELLDYMRYWSRLNWLGHITFEEYRSGKTSSTDES